MLSFSHLWKQQKLSDVDLCIMSTKVNQAQVLLPAHKAILSASPYFRVQMQQWMHQPDDSGDVSDSQRNNSASPGTDHPAAGRRARRASQAADTRPKLSLRLDYQDGVRVADQLAAAEPVIAAMYSAGSLQKLKPEQLLCMTITADMLQLDGTAQQAVDCLSMRLRQLQPEESSTPAGSRAAVVPRQFMGLPAWPPAILPLFPALGTYMPVSQVADDWTRNCCPHAGEENASLTSSTASAVPMKAEMQQLLLDQFGDLDAVWRQPHLVDELMSLPLPAIVLLLSSCSIKVSAEDNMLYTAQAYLDDQPADRRAAAERALARLIRVPHLSKLWPSAAVLCEDPSKLLLHSLVPQLKQYMALTWVGPQASSDSIPVGYSSYSGSYHDGNAVLPPLRRGGVLRHGAARHGGAWQSACHRNSTSDEAKQVMTQLKQPECFSWFLGERHYTASGSPNGGVELVWELPVSELKAASLRAYACASKRTMTLDSDTVTPPLQGLSWGLRVVCKYDKAGQHAGSQLAVYTGPRNLPKGTYATTSHLFTISCPVRSLSGVRDRLQTQGLGWLDFFDLGVMAGDWDEAAWATKGLPAHGSLQLKLKVEPSP